MSAQRPAPLLRWLVLLAAVAGLFAMHGLAGHGVAHGATATDHASHAAAVHVEHAEHAPHAEGAQLAPSEPGEHPTGLMTLCLAVLAGLAAGLLALAGRRRTTLTTLLPRAPVRVVAARSRAPDPPDLLRLSVQRC